VVVYSYIVLEPEHVGRDADRRALIERAILRIGGIHRREFTDRGRDVSGFKALTRAVRADEEHATVIITIHLFWLARLGGLPALVRWLDLMHRSGIMLLALADDLDTRCPGTYALALGHLALVADHIDLDRALAIGRHGRRGGRPPKNDGLTPSLAADLIRQHGSIQAAAKATEYTYTRLRRLSRLTQGIVP
jgi:hypothetical protein